MEGIIIWIIIIVGWALISGKFSDSDGEISDSSKRELFDKIRLQLKVSEEIPPKDRGLPNVKCIAVKVKGLFGNPNENQTKVFLTIHDNTDLGDDEYGLPVLSAHPSFSEAGSRVFSLSTTYETSADTYFPDWFDFIYIPKELILPPNKGRRRLKFNSMRY